MKIIWTDGAVEDLQAAFDYLEASSPEAASRFAEIILTRVESLETIATEKPEAPLRCRL